MQKKDKIKKEEKQFREQIKMDYELFFLSIASRNASAKVEKLENDVKKLLETLKTIETAISQNKL